MTVNSQGNSQGPKPAPVKKPKRPGFFSRHAGVTYFLITFGCCIAAFAALGAVIYYVLLPRSAPVSAGSQISEISSQPDSSSVPSSSALPSGAASFTVLIVQVDDSPAAVSSSGSPALPAALTLLRLDADKQQVNVMAVPVELAAQYNSQPTTLGNVYASGGADAAATALLMKTGICSNYTCVVPFSKLNKIMNSLSGFNYQVPYAVSYVAQNMKVYSVGAGMQHLNGDAVEALIGSASYPGGTLQKYDVQADFIRSLAKEKLSGVYLDQAQSFYSDVFSSVTTAFQMNDLTDRQPYFTAAAKKGVSGFTVVKPQYTPTIVGQTAAYDYTASDRALFQSNFNAQ